MYLLFLIQFKDSPAELMTHSFFIIALTINFYWMSHLWRDLRRR